MGLAILTNKNVLFAGYAKESPISMLFRRSKLRCKFKWNRPPLKNQPALGEL